MTQCTQVLLLIATSSLHYHSVPILGCKWQVILIVDTPLEINNILFCWSVYTDLYTYLQQARFISYTLGLNNFETTVYKSTKNYNGLHIFSVQQILKQCEKEQRCFIFHWINIGLSSSAPGDKRQISFSSFFFLSFLTLFISRVPRNHQLTFKQCFCHCHAASLFFSFSISAYILCLG